MVSSDVLKKVAVYGATVSVLGAAFFHHRIQAKIASQDYYKKSLEVLKDHHHAVDAIGKPLRISYLHLGRDDIKIDNTHAQIVIPVKGSKTKGSLYSFASRKDDGGWVLERVELEVEPERHRIKILPSEG